MALGNFSSFFLKKETVKGTAVKPNKALKIEGASVNQKVNTRAVNQIEGSTFKPSILIKSTIESGGAVDFFADQENLLYFLSIVLDAPIAVNNGNGTYTYSFDVDSYGIPTFTIETSKDYITERIAGVIGSKLDLSVDTEVIKGNLELMGLKAFNALKITDITGDVLTVDGDPSVLVAGDNISKNQLQTNLGSIVSVDTNNKQITLDTGDGAAFSIGDVITLIKQTPAYTAGLVPFRFFEKTKVKIADTIANLGVATYTPVADLGLTIANANDGKYMSGSNYANLIRQGVRNIEGKFTIPTDTSDCLDEFQAQQSLTKRAVEIKFEGDNEGSLTIKGYIQYKEAPMDIKVDEFIEIPFTFDFISDITIELKTTIASI